MAKSDPTILTRTIGKRGRPAGPSKATQEAFAALDTVMADKARQVTLRDTDDDGNVVAERSGVLVTPGDVGKPATYSGLPALIGSWAKDRGLSVSALAVTDGPERFVTNK